MHGQVSAVVQVIRCFFMYQVQWYKGILPSYISTSSISFATVIITQSLKKTLLRIGLSVQSYLVEPKVAHIWILVQFLNFALPRIDYTKYFPMPAILEI